MMVELQSWKELSSKLPLPCHLQINTHSYTNTSYRQLPHCTGNLSDATYHYFLPCGQLLKNYYVY